MDPSPSPEGGLRPPPGVLRPLTPVPLVVISHSSFYSINIPHFLHTVFLQLVPWAPLFKLRGKKSALDR